MAIPLLDLKAMHQPFRDQLKDILVEVLDSTAYINGPYVETFEKQLAAYCGADFAVGVSSGSDALIIGLMALNVKPGDEIITTPFTFFATAGAIARLGAVPVFVDIEPDSFNINPNLIEAAVTDKTVGIVPVSLFGQTADMDAINAIGEKHGLWVIEDAAQSIGARYKGKMSGTLSTAGTYSFFPAKNLGALGDGGAILTNDEDFAARLLTFRRHGERTRYYYDFVGGNFRLDAMQAALLSVKLPHLKGWEETRRKNAAVYNQAFAGHPEITCPIEHEDRYHIYNQYVIRLADGKRDLYKQRLDDWKIGNAIYYPLCLHQQKCFEYLGYQNGAFPESEKAADEVLALPIWTEQAEAVAAALLEEA